MENKNPFEDIRTYDNYTHLWQLTGFILLIQVAVSLLVYFWEQRSGVDLSSFEAIIPAQVVTGYISWVMLAGVGVSWREAWAEWNRNVLGDVVKVFKYFFGYAILMVCLAAVLVGAYYLLQDRMYSAVRPLGDKNAAENAMLSGVAAFSYLRFLVVLAGACIVAPLAEEVFFRRIMFATLRKRRGFWFSAFWSSLVFSFFHGLAAPMILPIGIYFCWVYERERRLSVNIMLHSLVNLVMVSLKLVV